MTSPIKLLLVDDEKDFHINFDSAFKNTFNTTYIDDLILATQIVTKEQFDIMIIDLKMTPKNFEGMEFIKSIKSNNNKQLIIAISNHEEKKLEVLKIGANIFLAKKDFSPSWARIIKDLVKNNH